MKHDDMMDSLLYASHALCPVPTLFETAKEFATPLRQDVFLREAFGDVNVLDCVQKCNINMKYDGRQEFELIGILPDGEKKARAHYEKMVREGTYRSLFLTSGMPQVKNVYFNGRSTTVEWTDGTKTTVRAQDGVEFDEYVGVCACLAKKVWKSSGVVKKLLKSDKIHRQRGKKKKAKKGGEQDGASGSES